MAAARSKMYRNKYIMFRLWGTSLRTLGKHQAL